MSICSFCNYDSSKSGKRTMYNSKDRPFLNICEVCVSAAYKVVKKDQYTMFEEELNLVNPKALKAKLDEYIVSQDEAKRVVSIAVHNHYKKILAQAKGNLGIELGKSNILMLGPTGSGKTLIAQTLAKILKVPFAMGDATSLTEAGYVGDDVESLLHKLYIASGKDVSKAERGIIFIDEVDKLGRRGENMSITRDVSGEGVQQALLKLIEGSEVDIPKTGGRKNPMQEMVTIDTSDILFILGGMFEGISEGTVDEKSDRSIGFANYTKKEDTFVGAINPQRLLNFGLIPELVGRIPVVVELETLSEEDMVHVLTKVKNNIIDQYKTLAGLDNANLEFTEEAYLEIAKQAIKRKLGARGLRTLVEYLTREIFYEAPYTEEETILIDKDYINEKLVA